MSSVKRVDSLHRTNSNQRTLISELREEIEELKSNYERSEERRDSLQEALGEEKAKLVEIVAEAKKFQSEVQKRNDKLEEEVLDRLRPIQGKYSASEAELKETKEALGSKTEEFSELESNYSTLESQLIEERAKNTDDLTETHPELMPLLEFLHEKNKEYVDARTQYESNLEEVVEKFKTTKPHKTMRYFLIKRESDGEIMTKKDDFSFKYKRIIEGFINEVEWSEFDEHVDRVRSDFDEAIEYIAWSEKMDNITQKMQNTSSTYAGQIFDSQRKINRAINKLDKLDSKKDELAQASPITPERFDEIFQVKGISMAPVEWIHLIEPHLQIHDKLDEKTYTQLIESYTHMKEKENISVFALENIVDIRNRFLE